MAVSAQANLPRRHAPRIVLPVLLKRYSYHDGFFSSGARRNDRPVTISNEVREHIACSTPSPYDRSRSLSTMLLGLGVRGVIADGL